MRLYTCTLFRHFLTLNHDFYLFYTFVFFFTKIHANIDDNNNHEIRINEDR